MAMGIFEVWENMLFMLSCGVKILIKYRAVRKNESKQRNHKPNVAACLPDQGRCCEDSRTAGCHSGDGATLPGAARAVRRSKAGQAAVGCAFSKCFSLQRGNNSWIRQDNCGHDRSSQTQIH